MKKWILIFFVINFTMLSAHKYRLLITGCSASGTTYISKVLQKSGFDAGHEQMGKDGIVSWLMVGNRIGYYNESYIGNPQTDFEHIFHQIRDPLKVIRDRHALDVNKNLDNYTWCFQRSVIPEMHREDSLLVHCAKFYYYWNLKAEQMAEFSYRIEDFESILPEFELRLGHTIDRTILSEVSTKTNSWELTKKGEYIDITWELLERELPDELYINLRELAKRYGYET